jgi:acetyl-CoA carboxylase biotin carboxyl carrier protein
MSRRTTEVGDVDQRAESAALDATGLRCPLPVLRARKRLAAMPPGAVLEVLADDPAAEADMRAFCQATGHRLLAVSRDRPGVSLFRIARGPLGLTRQAGQGQKQPASADAGGRPGKGEERPVADIRVKSEITGKVWTIEAKPGDRLNEEDPIIVLESMKMEIPVVAPASGTLKQILVEQGETVQEGQVVAVLEG